MEEQFDQSLHGMLKPVNEPHMQNVELLHPVCHPSKHHSSNAVDALICIL